MPSNGELPATTRVLVVANRTAATHRLLETVKQRARALDRVSSLCWCRMSTTGRQLTGRWRAPCRCSLERAARGPPPVEGLVGGSDPFESVQSAVRFDGHFDEIIISTLPKPISKRLRRDLIRRVEGLGLPVTAIVPQVAGDTSIEAP